MTDPIEGACRAYYDEFHPGLGWAAIRGAGREHRLEAMRLALAGYEAALWIPVEHAPAEWEGTVVLCAHPDGRPVEQRLLRHGYSRDPRHCGGLRVRKLPVPPNVGEKPDWTEIEKVTP